MSVTKRSFIIGAIGLLICICAYIYSQKFSKKVVIDISDYPSFVATDTYTINYGVEGNIENTMTSTYTEYFDPKQYFTFRHPFLTRYKYEDDAVNLWHIKGEKGHMFVNKLARIEESVVVYPGFEDTNIKRATSKYF
ncbi:MAG: LPS export ABC transporter periplasmic protein LptC, partial [Succinivibrio sp.]